MMHESELYIYEKWQISVCQSDIQQRIKPSGVIHHVDW
jgi:hypothetical protein